MPVSSAQLAHGRVGHGLAGLDAAAGKLPPPAERGIGTVLRPQQQDGAVRVLHDYADDVALEHRQVVRQLGLWRPQLGTPAGSAKAGMCTTWSPRSSRHPS